MAVNEERYALLMERGEARFREIVRELNQLSYAHCRKRAEDWRRHCDLDEILLALGLIDEVFRCER